MRVVLSEWVVGDGQVREPVVGEVIPQRMLILFASKLVSIDPDAVAGPAEDQGDDQRLIGVVTWRGASASGDATVLDCGFPVRVESEFKSQHHRLGPGQRGFRGLRWREWLIPVDLDVPPVGTPLRRLGRASSGRRPRDGGRRYRAQPPACPSRLADPRSNLLRQRGWQLAS